jgi:hypothetical protein
MAITFDATSPGNTYNNSASSVTYSHTCGAGDNRILLVGTWTELANSSVSGVTYGGTALSAAPSSPLDFRYGSWRISLWYLVAPGAGANDVVATATASGKIYVVSASYTGVHQTTPFGTAGLAASADAVDNSATVTVSSAVDELVVDLLFVPYGATTGRTVGANQTIRAACDDNSTTGNCLDMSSEAGASDVTMSWSFTSNHEWGIFAVPLKPSAPAASFIPSIMRTQFIPSCVGSR